MELDGKAVLVTGAARGLGKTIAAAAVVVLLVQSNSARPASEDCFESPTRDCLLTAAIALANAAPPTQRGEMLAAVAAKQAQYGNPDEARRTLSSALSDARRVVEPEKHVALLRFIAGVQSDLDDGGAARRTLAEAVALVESEIASEPTDSGSAWISTLRQLARSQWAAGDGAGGVATLQRLTNAAARYADAGTRAVELMLTASVQSEIDDRHGAETTLARAHDAVLLIELAELKAETLLSVASEANRLGLRRPALESLEAARVVMRGLPDSDYLARLGVTLALEWLEALEE